MYAPFAGTAAAHPGAVTVGAVLPLSGGEAAAIGLLAFALVMIPVLFALVEHLDVMAHEGMHALIGGLLAFELLEFVIHPNANGGVRHKVESWGLKYLLVLLVGYFGPSAFGLLGAKLIETGHVIAVLWVAIVLLGLLLTVLSVSFGFITVPLVGVLLILLVHYSHAGLEEFVAYLLTWLMLLSGLRSAVKHGAKAGDAKTIAEKIMPPRHLWALIWIAGTLFALAVGGKWLVLGN
jgi:Peptidase M50B-like